MGEIHCAGNARCARAERVSREAPAGGAGFPPFKTETFPSQIFWLVVTFAFLFLVLWRVAGPRINGVITSRRNLINADIAAADRARGDAEQASAAYQTALAGARARAQLNAEIAKAKADTEAEAHRAMADADARIAATRVEAQTHIIKAAEEAAIAIVARLTGEAILPDDAARAVKEG